MSVSGIGQNFYQNNVSMSLFLVFCRMAVKNEKWRKMKDRSMEMKNRSMEMKNRSVGLEAEVYGEFRKRSDRLPF